MLKLYYIYRHIRPDIGQVFYVGKGKNRRNFYNYERAHQPHKNPIWQRIVAKCGGRYEVEIVMEFETAEECVRKEIELIRLYGRTDQKCGMLCNLTNGGEGGYGRIYSEKQREARRACVSGNKHPNWGKQLSSETCRRKSLAISGDKHFLYGKKLPLLWRKHIGEAKIGDRNPMYGKCGRLSKRSKIIRDTNTGTIYYGIQEAAAAFNLTPSILYQYLDGTRKNKTPLVCDDTLRSATANLGRIAP